MIALVLDRSRKLQIVLKACSGVRNRARSMRRSHLNRWNQVGIAARLCEIREDLYGEHGGQFLADALEIPLQTWLNYESGVVAPADVVLQLIVMARVSPHWLLTGQGEMLDHRIRQYEAGNSVS
jgi:hypothetical protein